MFMLKCYLIFKNWLHVTANDVTVTFDKQRFIVFKNYHYIIVPLKQSPAAHRIHLPARRRVSTHSAQRRPVHRTGCGPAVKISSQKTMASKFLIPYGVQCWKLTARLKQSWKQAPNSRKRFRLSGTDRQGCKRFLK